MRENNFIVEILNKKIEQNIISNIGVNFTITCIIGVISDFEAIEMSQLKDLNSASEQHFKNISPLNFYGSIKLINTYN